MKQFLIITIFTLTLTTSLSFATLPIQAENTPDLVCIGEEYAEYFLALQKKLPPLSHVNLLTPTFNMTNNRSITIWQTAVDNGLSAKMFWGFSGNTYTLATPDGWVGAYDYYSSNWKNTVDSSGVNLIFAEFGDFGLFDDDVLPLPARPLVINRMKQEFNRTSADPNIQSINYFNGLGTNPGFDQFLLHNNEFEIITNNNPDKSGANSAMPIDSNFANIVNSHKGKWLVNIANSKGDLGNTLALINQAHSLNINPIIRACACKGRNCCGFSNPADYAEFISQIDNNVSAPVWIIAGPNEPQSEYGAWGFDCQEECDEPHSCKCFCEGTPTNPCQDTPENDCSIPVDPERLISGDLDPRPDHPNDPPKQTTIQRIRDFWHHYLADASLAPGGYQAEIQGSTVSPDQCNDQEYLDTYPQVRDICASGAGGGTFTKNIASQLPGITSSTDPTTFEKLYNNYTFYDFKEVNRPRDESGVNNRSTNTYMQWYQISQLMGLKERCFEQGVVSRKQDTDLWGAVQCVNYQVLPCSPNCPNGANNTFQDYDNDGYHTERDIFGPDGYLNRCVQAPASPDCLKRFRRLPDSIKKYITKQMPTVPVATGVILGVFEEIGPDDSVEDDFEPYKATDNITPLTKNSTHHSNLQDDNSDESDGNILFLSLRKIRSLNTKADQPQDDIPQTQVPPQGRLFTTYYIKTFPGGVNAYAAGRINHELTLNTYQKNHLTLKLNARNLDMTWGGIELTAREQYNLNPNGPFWYDKIPFDHRDPEIVPIFNDIHSYLNLYYQDCFQTPVETDTALVETPTKLYSDNSNASLEFSTQQADFTNTLQRFEATRTPGDYAIESVLNCETFPNWLQRLDQDALNTSNVFLNPEQKEAIAYTDDILGEFGATHPSFTKNPDDQIGTIEPSRQLECQNCNWCLVAAPGTAERDSLINDCVSIGGQVSPPGENCPQGEGGAFAACCVEDPSCPHVDTHIVLHTKTLNTREGDEDGLNAVTAEGDSPYFFRGWIAITRYAFKIAGDLFHNNIYGINCDKVADMFLHPEQCSVSLVGNQPKPTPTDCSYADMTVTIPTPQELQTYICQAAAANNIPGFLLRAIFSIEGGPSVVAFNSGQYGEKVKCHISSTGDVGPLQINVPACGGPSGNTTIPADCSFQEGINAAAKILKQKAIMAGAPSNPSAWTYEDIYKTGGYYNGGYQTSWHCSENPFSGEPNVGNLNGEPASYCLYATESFDQGYCPNDPNISGQRPLGWK